MKAFSEVCLCYSSKKEKVSPLACGSSPHSVRWKVPALPLIITFKPRGLAAKFYASFRTLMLNWIQRGKKCLCQSGVAADNTEYRLGWWQFFRFNSSYGGPLPQSSKSWLPSVLQGTLPQPNQIREWKVFLKPNLKHKWVGDSVFMCIDCSFTFRVYHGSFHSGCQVLLEAGEFAVMFQLGFCDITASSLIVTCMTHHTEFRFGQSGLCNHFLIHPSKLKPGCLNSDPGSPFLFSKLLKLTVSQFAQL